MFLPLLSFSVFTQCIQCTPGFPHSNLPIFAFVSFRHPRSAGYILPFLSRCLCLLRRRCPAFRSQPALQRHRPCPPSMRDRSRMAAAKASGTTAVTMRFLFRPIPLKKAACRKTRQAAIIYFILRSSTGRGGCSRRKRPPPCHCPERR